MTTGPNDTATNGLVSPPRQSRASGGRTEDGRPDGKDEVSKVVLQVSALSLDGYICEEGTAVERLATAMGDDEARDAWMIESLWQAGVHIMGRVTYESMAAHWPRSSEPFAEVMNAIPKVAFSRTPIEAGWAETTVASGDTALELARLTSRVSGHVIAHGGARFAQHLAGSDLVDEYRLIVYPIVAGTGTSLFAAAGAAPRQLQLVSTTSFPGGSFALVLRR